MSCFHKKTIMIVHFLLCICVSTAFAADGVTVYSKADRITSHKNGVVITRSSETVKVIPFSVSQNDNQSEIRNDCQ